MTRYTDFAKLCADANFGDTGHARVWLRDCNSWLRVTYYRGEEQPTYYLNGQQIGETRAVDLFFLEMRVYGWVSTERVL